MEWHKKEYGSLLLIAVALSSYQLIVDSMVKYLFLVFEVALIVLLTLLFFQPKSPTKSVGNVLRGGKRASLRSFLLDSFFMIVSGVLLLLNIAGIFILPSILLAFIVFSLLPGHFILRLLGISDRKSWSEKFILSYVLSFPLTGIITFFLVPLEPVGNREALLSIPFFMTAILIIKDLAGERKQIEEKAGLKGLPAVGILIMAASIIFFCSVMLSLYPAMAFVPGNDIIRHYSSAISLEGMKANLANVYLFFQLYQAAIYSVSMPSLEVYQTFFASTSIVVILSFYIMAKKYLSGIDRRLPVFATVFWAAFSGLGWIFFFGGKLAFPNAEDINIFWRAYDATYADVGYGISTNMWLWFLPTTVSFTILFVLLYLLKRDDVPKRSLILIMSLLVVALYFIHMYELVIFAVLIVFLSLLGQKEGLCIHEALISSLIGLAGTSVIAFLANSGNFALTFIVPLALTALVGITCLFELSGWRGMSSKRRSQFVKLFSSVLIVFFVAGIFGWVQWGMTFSMSQVGDIFVVPWFFYPVRLGVVGFLGLCGMLIIGTKFPKNPVAVFPLLFITAVIAGRVISFINVTFFYTGISEWRLLFFSYAAASISATFLIREISSHFLKNVFRGSSKRILVGGFLIGVVVVGGISSTFLTIDKMSNIVTDGFSIQQDELNAVSFLTSTSQTYGIRPLLTVTHQSVNILQYVPSPWVEENMIPVIWSPKYPEIPLNFLFNVRYLSPYIYLGQRDSNEITTTNLNEGYLANIVLQAVREVYSSSNITVDELPDGVPPVQNAKSVVVIPQSERIRSDLISSYILSIGGYNYTVMLATDPAIYRTDTLIFPSDSMRAGNITELALKGNKSVIILDLDGYGPLSRQFLQSQNNDFSINVKSGTGIFIQSLMNNTPDLTSLSENLFDGRVESIIYNEEQRINYLSIVNESQTTFWTDAGGFGIGSVSAPILTSAPSLKADGVDSLNILVQQGGFQEWYIQHYYSEVQDWSNRDFLTMWWYGTDSGQTIALQAPAPDWSNYFQYSFEDDFSGWHRSAMPLESFARIGEPEWNRIAGLGISSLNGGIAGSWHIGPIGLEDGNNASIEVVVHNPTSELPTLSVFNGLINVPVASLQANSTIIVPASRFYFLDGSNAGKVFGDRYGIAVRLEKIHGTDNVTLSLRIPPGDSAFSRLRLGLEYEASKTNVTLLSTPTGQVTLPLEIRVSPFNTTEGSNVLAWYIGDSGKIPLAIIRPLTNGANMIFLNVYPILSAAHLNSTIFQALLKIIASLLDVPKLPKYDKTIWSWIMQDNIPTLAFKRGTLYGNISISATSIIPYENLNLSRVSVYINNSQILMNNVRSIRIQNTGGNIFLSSERVKIGSGIGFYASIAAENPKLVVTGDQILISVIMSNYTRIELQGKGEAELSVQGNLLSYLLKMDVTCVGAASFLQAYAFHSYAGNLRTMGQNLLFNGTVRFGLPLSDEFSIASNFIWSGTASREPPYISWDELNNIFNSIPDFLLAATLLFVFYKAKHLIQKRRRSYDVARNLGRWSAQDLKKQRIGKSI